MRQLKNYRFDVRFFSVSLWALKIYHSETFSEYAHRFSLRKDSPDAEVIPKEKRRLDKYDCEDLKSFHYHSRSVEQTAYFPPPDRTLLQIAYLIRPSVSGFLSWVMTGHC